MSHNLISRRRRTLVASATIALMCLAPNAQASGGDHDVQKPRQDHASDTQAAKLAK